jgi:hypothetical protein
MTARHIAGAAGPPDGAYDADVVILSLDRAAETAAAIGSALAQTGVSRHVFIVDQGSRPETLARLAAPLQSAAARRRVIRYGHFRRRRARDPPRGVGRL